MAEGALLGMARRRESVSTVASIHPSSSFAPSGFEPIGGSQVQDSCLPLVTQLWRRISEDALLIV